MTRFKKALDEISAGTAMNAARLRNRRAKISAESAADALEKLMNAKKSGMKKLNPKEYKDTEGKADLAYMAAVRDRMQANKNKKRADKKLDAEAESFFSDQHESMSEGSDKGGLRGWFEGGGWDRYDSKGNKIGKCGGRKEGEAKPKCFSREKAAKLGKKGRAAAVRKKRRDDPNPNRRGKPINTPSTKKGLKMRKDSSTEIYSDVYTKLAETIVRTLLEKKDACYRKVKASAKVWPSAYASGRLVQCRKRGASNYGKSKQNSSTEIIGDFILNEFRGKYGHRRVLKAQRAAKVDGIQKGYRGDVSARDLLKSEKFTRRRAGRKTDYGTERAVAAADAEAKKKGQSPS